MYHAFTVVNAWFEEQENATLAAINLYKALTSSVYVIWYEAPQEPEFDSRALFTRLNVGRIPLTDAELVKASLLSRIERQHETAAQWDSIERDLWSPEVWAFATGSSTGGATRIELLLDTVADSISGDGPTSAPFQTFETLRPHIVADPKDALGPGGGPALPGPRLVRRPQPLPQDRVPGRGRAHSFFDLVELARGTAKSTFERRTRWTHHQEPRPSLARGRRIDIRQQQDGTGTPPDERRDGTPQPALVRALLVQRACARLWSLEHIHAQNSEGLNTVEQWTAWLNEHRKALDALDIPSDERDALQSRIDAALPTITSDTFEPLHREMVTLFTASGRRG